MYPLPRWRKRKSLQDQHAEGLLPVELCCGMTQVLEFIAPECSPWLGTQVGG